MRVDYDQVKIKDLDTSNNPLLNKRRKKPVPPEAAQAEAADQGCTNHKDVAEKDRENITEQK